MNHLSSCLALAGRVLYALESPYAVDAAKSRSTLERGARRARLLELKEEAPPMAVSRNLFPIPSAFLPRVSRAAAPALCLALAFSAVTGCSTKKYVRSQTTPLVTKTNELDDQTAANNRSLQDLDKRTSAGIGQAQASANQAQQSAASAGQSANQAQASAQEAVNRAGTLASVVANLDSYQKLSDISVNFGFNKAELTSKAKAELDSMAAQLASQKSYILQLTGGTDSVGSAEYNYDLSERRAQAVVQYLATKYNVPAHRFYLIGLGRDQAVASNSSAAGRAKNRRVEVQLLSNQTGAPVQAPQQTGSYAQPTTGQTMGQAGQSSAAGSQVTSTAGAPRQ